MTNKFHLVRCFANFSITGGFGNMVEKHLYSSNIPNTIILERKNSKVIDVKYNIEYGIFTHSLYLLFYIKVKCKDILLEKKELKDTMIDYIKYILNYYGSSLFVVLDGCGINIIY